jgi:hypothetical protein
LSIAVEPLFVLCRRVCQIIIVIVAHNKSLVVKQMIVLGCIVVVVELELAETLSPIAFILLNKGLLCKFHGPSSIFLLI